MQYAFVSPLSMNEFLYARNSNHDKSSKYFSWVQRSEHKIDIAILVVFGFRDEFLPILSHKEDTNVLFTR